MLSSEATLPKEKGIPHCHVAHAVLLEKEWFSDRALMFSQTLVYENMQAGLYWPSVWLAMSRVASGRS